MVIGLIATMKILDGKNAEFEAFFSELRQKVLDNEPGVIYYSLHRSKEDSQTYRVMEQYADEVTFKEHSVTDYFKAAGPVFMSFLAAKPDLEILDCVD